MTFLTLFEQFMWPLFCFDFAAVCSNIYIIYMMVSMKARWCWLPWKWVCIGFVLSYEKESSNCKWFRWWQTVSVYIFYAKKWWKPERECLKTKSGPTAWQEACKGSLKVYWLTGSIATSLDNLILEATIVIEKRGAHVWWAIEHLT